MSMNKMAIAELVAALAAHVSLVREVAYPTTGGLTVTVLGVRRSWGRRRESHASDVVPMVYNKTSLGREDQERQEGISTWAWQ